MVQVRDKVQNNNYIVIRHGFSYGSRYQTNFNLLNVAYQFLICENYYWGYLTRG